MIEEWKDVVGYEGYYQVSNLGNVKGIKRMIWHSFKKSYITIPGRSLKKRLDKHGYLKVKLSKNNINKLHSIHRLVATTFIPNVDNKREVNHIDGNKKNNHLSNLEWVTSSENHIHAIQNNLLNEKLRLKKICRKVRQLDKKLNVIKEYDSLKQATENTGIAWQSISDNCRGNRKSAGGYKWEYVKEG